MRIGLNKKTVLLILVCLAVTGCWKSSDERAAEHYENGLKLVEAGDENRALVEFRNTIRLAENNIEARRQIAQIHLKKGNRRGAYRNYLRIVERKPDDQEGRQVLSELAFLGRDWKEFERHSKAVVELAPEVPAVKAIDLGAQYRNAVISEDSLSRNKIVAAAESLASDLPDNEILRQILVDGYVGQERYELALEELDKSLTRIPEDKGLYTSKLELLSRMGRNDDVEAELRHMAEIFPDDENIKATLLRFFMSRGQAKKAEEFLRVQVVSTEGEDKRSAIGSLIRFLLQTSGPESALSELEAAIAETPDDDVLRSLRASINFDAGRQEEGIVELQDILGAENNNLTVLEAQNIRIALARMQATIGNEVGARKLVEEVLADDVNAVSALKMQAGWLIREDNTDGAISALRTALDQAPEDADAMTLMAQAYQRSGDRDLMLNFLLLAVEASGNAPDNALAYAGALAQDEKYLQAESVLINSLRISPDNIGVLSLLGNIYLALDDFPRAKQVVETLREIDLEAANNNANSLEADLLQKKFGRGEVMNFLEGLSAEGGSQADTAKMALLRSQLQVGEVAEALEFAQDLVAKNPSNIAFRNALALTYAAAGNYDQAEADFRDLLKENPRNLWGWLQLARLQSALDDMDGAMSVLDEGLALNPDAPDLLWGKASIMQENGNIDGAIEIYEALYGRFSQSEVIANNLASLLSTFRADDVEALARAQVIARRLQGTELPSFQDTYGWLQHLAGKSEDALTYLEPAAEGLPQEVTVQIHLGMVYAALDMRDKALEQLRRAVDIAGPVGTERLLENARAKIAELETQ